MKVLRFREILRNFVGFNGAPQAVFTFFLFPICLSLNFTASPLIPNIPFLWAWNAPTELCDERFDVHLDLSLFSLVGSPRENIKGQDITLFYADRLGYYPYIEQMTARNVNGGIPQMGSLQKHLEKAKEDISNYMPADNVGLAVIDWEDWRPIWERNWKPKDIYKSQSIELIQQQNIQLNVIEATKIAKEDFEKAARSFMQETLKLGKLLRPNCLWGYYLFPDCYNHNYNEPSYNGSCFDIEKRRNNELNWLWKESTALFPSIYLKSNLKSSLQAAFFVRNRVQEAIRISKVPNASNPLPVFVYARPVFSDMSKKFLSQDNLVNTIGESVALGVSGIIMWGSLNMSQTRLSCLNLDNYMKTTLNPYLINVTLAAKMCSQVLCQEQGVCTRKHWNSNDYLHLNPMSFAIRTGKGGQYTIHGKPTLEDLQQYSENFYCSCYTNVSCKERIDMNTIHTIHVCIAEDICIDAFLNSELRSQLPTWKVTPSSSKNVSSSLPPAPLSPCVPGKDLNGSFKGECSKEVISNNTREGCRSVKWKNTSIYLCHQKKITKRNYSRASLVLIKFSVYILYVLMFTFLYLII